MSSLSSVSRRLESHRLGPQSGPQAGIGDLHPKMEAGYRYHTGMEASSRYTIPVSQTQPVCHPYRRCVSDIFYSIFIKLAISVLPSVITLEFESLPGYK